MDKQEFIRAMGARCSMGTFGVNYRISHVAEEDLVRVATPEVLYGEDIVVYQYALADGFAVIVVPADAGELIEEAVLLV